MKIFNKRLLSVLASSAVVGMVQQAMGQQVVAQDGKVALEEVVVTAQKREQNLQEVPVSITSYSEYELEKKGITSIVELEKSIPNGQFRASRATNSTLTAYIRGVGQQDPLWGFEPGVGVYVDDVYYARPQAAVLDVFDVERIEVLRGPQGTLYGKNTVGGAIKYITKRMSGEATGKIKAAVGTYGQQELTVSGELPIIDDKLYAGVAIAKLDRDGYGDVRTGYDIITGKFSSKEDNYNKDVLVQRATLEMRPAEQWFVRFAFDKTEDDSNQPCGSPTNANTSINPGTGLPFDTSSDPYDSDCGTTHKSKVETEGYSLTVEYDVNDSLSLKYIYADREGETVQFIDFDGTPLDAFDVPAKYVDDQESHELQFNFSAPRFDLVGGLYYYEGNAGGAFDVVLNDAVAPSNFFDGSHTDLGIDGDVDTESTSAYLNGSFEITDALTLTAGVRSTKDEKDSNIRRVLLFTGNSFPYSTSQGSAFTHGSAADDLTLAVFTDLSDKEAKNDWSEVSPSVKLDWKASDNIMLFIGYAEGFKSGGFDMRGNALTNLSLAEGYDPETVETFEAGIKSQLWDDRVRLNFTVFSSDYKDMQLTVQAAQPAPIFFSSDVVNAGEAEIDGAELEGLAQLTEALSATLVLGYMNAELVEVISGGVDVSDTWEMLNAPNWNGQFALNYDMDLGDYGNLTLNTALSYRDASRHFNNVTCSCDQEKSYTLVDVGAVWTSLDGHWSSSLVVKNASDEEYKTGGYNNFNELAFYGPPRTVTASVTYQF